MPLKQQQKKKYFKAQNQWKEAERVSTFKLWPRLLTLMGNKNVKIEKEENVKIRCSFFRSAAHKNKGR
jgi:hypothetical protein